MDFCNAAARHLKTLTRTCKNRLIFLSSVRSRIFETFHLVLSSVAFVSTNDYFVHDCSFILNSKYSIFIGAHLILIVVNCTIPETPRQQNNSSNSSCHIYSLECTHSSQCGCDGK